MIGVDMAEQSIARTNPPARSRNPGILVIDDMGLILTLLKCVLESRGFVVWLAENGDDAIDLYRQNRAEIDLVLLDVHMPGSDGPHTLGALRRLAPDLLACFMTGTLAATHEMTCWNSARPVSSTNPSARPNWLNRFKRFLSPGDSSGPSDRRGRSARRRRTRTEPHRRENPILR